MAIGDRKPVVMEADIVNDLTTGGASMALSAEMGKKLNTEQNKLLPLDGSKAMTGPLKLQNSGATGGSYLQDAGADNLTIIVRNDALNANVARYLQLFNSAGQSDIKEALRLRDRTSAGYTNYTILHTGNKPTGSYTGNGSATRREIATGGFGDIAVIYGTDGQMALATPWGSIFRNGNTISVTSELAFNGGNVVTKSAVDCNVNGVTYVYQVL